MNKNFLVGFLLLGILVGCPQTPAPTSTPTPVPVVADWYTYMTSFRGQDGSRLSYTCPAKPTGVGTVWGTDVYTDDSAICVAALHASKITEAGGTFTLEIRAGQASYVGSTRNGVTTSDYGSWGGSYAFVN